MKLQDLFSLKNKKYIFQGQGVKVSEFFLKVRFLDTFFFSPINFYSLYHPLTTIKKQEVIYYVI